MGKPYHYIITFTRLWQISALENPLVLADKKYTHPIKGKQEVECYVPWKSYSVLNCFCTWYIMTFPSSFKEKKSSISKPCVGGKKKNLSWIISLRTSYRMLFLYNAWFHSAEIRRQTVPVFSAHTFAPGTLRLTLGPCSHTPAGSPWLWLAFYTSRSWI